MAKTLRLGILLSGGGRTLENILRHVAQPPSAVKDAQMTASGPPKIAAEVAVVIASRPRIRGIEIAERAGIACHLLRPRDFPNVQAYSDAMIRVLDEAQVGLVCLAGFLSYWIVPDRYLGRVMNIHPALLPSFGGRGMYGHRVHEAVLACGCKVSGCTVHFLNNKYDEGPIILQRPVPAYADDTADDLAARVFQEECIAYPEAIRLFAQGRLRIEGQRVHIDDLEYRRP